MKNSKTIFSEIKEKITISAEPDEVDSIVRIIMENILQTGRTRILSNQEINVSEEQLTRIARVVQRVNAYEPIQYIFNESFFYGRKFYVDRSVLIPRPETEILVDVVIQFLHKEKSARPNVLDIGTGSGIIPVTIKCEVPETRMYASDVSLEALEVARKNAASFETEVEFMHHHILQSDLPYGMFHAIASNPPYVTEKEKKTMKRNVLDFEPELALFVPDDDPLIFYRAISKKAKDALVPGGLLAVEINESFGRETASLFSDAGFEKVVIIKDYSGKDRVVKGEKSAR